MPIDPDALYSPGDLEALGEGKHTTIFNRIASGEYGPVFKDGPPHQNYRRWHPRASRAVFEASYVRSPKGLKGRSASSRRQSG